ncbi:sensor histidine kinase [Eubacterium sp. 1001713B170207_170306_E7]|uniref:sensor histidine kinase n=1 Tax=Eubacterium sp. 1001713B170207_170306_E7 TaxID=2787097 RepID=UPI00189A4DFB|nr:sensor histidine kinase [Eubacterium sp. 1001713B170207_170306_E7]
MKEIWVQIFAAVFEAVLIYYWVRAFSREKKIKRRWIVLEVTLVSLWILISLVFVKNPLLLISFTAAACILMFFIYRVPVKISLVATLVFCVVMALCDVLAIYILMFLSGENIETIRFTAELMLMGNLLTKFLILCFVSFVYVRNKTDFSKLFIKKTIYLLVLPLASIVLLYQLLSFSDMENPFSIMMCLIGIAGLFIGNIYSFIFFEKEEELEEQNLKEFFLKQQIENQRTYYQSLESSNEEMRKIRHDLKNAFIALSGYLDIGDVNAARQYVDRQIHTIKQLTYSTGYPAIDAVVNVKKTKALEKNIQFDMKISLPKELLVDEMDLCIILGNALDNALEACEKMPCGQGEIILSLRKTGGMLLLDIKNTIDKEPVKDSDGLITTKKDQVNHGFGLKTIYQLTKQYDGTMDYEVKNGWFYLMINLNLKDSVDSAI